MLPQEIFQKLDAACEIVSEAILGQIAALAGEMTTNNWENL